MQWSLRASGVPLTNLDHEGETEKPYTLCGSLSWFVNCLKERLSRLCKASETSHRLWRFKWKKTAISQCGRANHGSPPRTFETSLFGSSETISPSLSPCLISMRSP